jgi:hypothetical protein
MESARCPSMDEWIMKTWHICMMEYYSARKNNEILSFAEKWIELEVMDRTKQNKPESEIQIMHVFSHMKNLDLIERDMRARRVAQLRAST